MPARYPHVPDTMLKDLVRKLGTSSGTFGVPTCDVGGDSLLAGLGSTAVNETGTETRRSFIYRTPGRTTAWLDR